MQTAIQEIKRTNGPPQIGILMQRVQKFKPDSERYSGIGSKGNLMRLIDSIGRLAAGKDFAENFAKAAEIAANFQSGARLSKEAKASTAQEISVEEFREIAMRMASAAKEFQLSSGANSNPESREAMSRTVALVSKDIRNPIIAEIKKRCYNERRFGYSGNDVGMWNAANSMAAAFSPPISKHETKR